MTKTEKRILWRRVRLFKVLMSLKAWNIEPSVNEDEAVSHVKPSWQYRETDLNFDPSKLPSVGADRDDLIRHELGHLHLAPLSEFARILCKGDAVLLEVLDQIEDRAVTDLARMEVWRAVPLEKE